MEMYYIDFINMTMCVVSILGPSNITGFAIYLQINGGKTAFTGCIRNSAE